MKRIYPLFVWFMLASTPGGFFVAPVFGAGTVSWYPALLTAANTSRVGTGTVAIVMTAEKTVYVDRIIFRAAGTNVASCGRIFLNNGQPTTTAKNNVLVAEITLDATTASEVAALPDEVLQLDMHIPAGYRVFATLGTAVSAGWSVTCVTKDLTDVLE